MLHLNHSKFLLKILLLSAASWLTERVINTLIVLRSRCRELNLHHLSACESYLVLSSMVLAIRCKHATFVIVVIATIKRKFDARVRVFRFAVLAETSSSETHRCLMTVVKAWVRDGNVNVYGCKSLPQHCKQYACRQCCIRTPILKTKLFS